MEARYRRMIECLKVAPEPAAPKDWSVYILRCADGSLYTGIAKDVEARVAKHGLGKGAAYTRSRRPVSLLYREPGLTRSQALVREARIKTLPRPKKEELATSHAKSSSRRPRAR